jgi:type I restriction enzyme S subunit
VTAIKPYPSYKPSGVPWLGEVPEHWEMRRAKFLFRHRKELNVLRREQNVLSLTLRGVVNNDPDNPEGLVPGDYASYQVFDTGDLVFKLIDLENLRTSRVGLVPERGIMSSAYVRLTPRHDGIRRFFFHQFYDLYTRGVYNQLGAGVRSTLGPADLLNLSVLRPPLDEQSAIVRYLDHMDRRIRKYIRAKQKLIELLNEQKQAVINHAVTRGLDPNVKLKPSGVPWLGDVPEHWTLSRVKNEFLCLDHSRIPLSATERGTMTLRQYDYYGASSVIDKVDGYLFDGELLLIAEDGANLVLRNLPLAIIARGKFWVNNHAHILKSRRGNLEFLASVMETINYQPWISGAAQPKLTQDRLMGIAIAVPPRKEQDRIVDWTQDETKPVRSAIDRTRREIDLLREYRTRLVADVVTGKLDVRAAAAKLPEEAEEAELQDEIKASVGDTEDLVGETEADDLEAGS